MNKKYGLFLFLFLVSVCLFSSPIREEEFIVRNLSNKELVINLVFLENPIERPWLVDIYGITVSIGWIPPGINLGENTAEVRLMPWNNRGIIAYAPFVSLMESDYYFDKLAELSFEEKMRAIFKTLSIRTIEGEYIIRDLDDLFSANIINGSDAYFLEIY